MKYSALALVVWLALGSAALCASVDVSAESQYQNR